MRRREKDGVRGRAVYFEECLPVEERSATLFAPERNVAGFCNPRRRHFALGFHGKCVLTEKPEATKAGQLRSRYPLVPSFQPSGVRAPHSCFPLSITETSSPYGMLK